MIVGDSAGGHLSVDLLLQPDVAANGPVALALFSPLIDLTLDLARAREDLGATRRSAPTMRPAWSRCTATASIPRTGG